MNICTILSSSHPDSSYSSTTHKLCCHRRTEVDSACWPSLDRRRLVVLPSEGFPSPYRHTRSPTSQDVGPYSQIVKSTCPWERTEVSDRGPFPKGFHMGCSFGSYCDSCASGSLRWVISRYLEGIISMVMSRFEEVVVLVAFLYSDFVGHCILTLRSHSGSILFTAGRVSDVDVPLRSSIHIFGLSVWYIGVVQINLPS
jgi:hypothetical protein